MRALTVRQPFASEIMAGRKPIENRSVRTHIRGRIGIHAAKAPHMLATMNERERIKFGSMPSAAMLGTVQIVGCHESGGAECSCPRDSYAAFAGDVYRMPGEIWHWEFARPRAFVTPIPRVVGALGFWEVDDRTEHLMEIAEVAL